MVCPYCSSKTTIENSRPQKRLNQVWRRRQCLSCNTVFTTEEVIDFTKSIAVRTREKVQKPFERDKLFISVYDSLKHRKTAQSDATALTATIISLLDARNSLLVTSVEISAITHTVLDRFDKVSAVHYRAFYPSH